MVHPASCGWATNFIPLTSPLFIRSKPPTIPSRPFGRTSYLLGCIDKYVSGGETTGNQATLMEPSSSHFPSLAHDPLQSNLFSCLCGFPYVNIVLRSFPSSSLTELGSVNTSVPPEPRSDHPICCVPVREIASYTTFIGLVVTLLTAALTSSAGRRLSNTCVAPSDLRNASCLGEAVVMIGEKPERRASWMTKTRKLGAHLQRYPQLTV